MVVLSISSYEVPKGLWQNQCSVPNCCRYMLHTMQAWQSYCVVCKTGTILRLRGTMLETRISFTVNWSVCLGGWGWVGVGGGVRGSGCHWELAHTQSCPWRIPCDIRSHSHLVVAGGWAGVQPDTLPGADTVLWLPSPEGSKAKPPKLVSIFPPRDNSVNLGKA